MNFDAVAIAKATNSNYGLVLQALSYLERAFILHGIDDLRAIAGALATVAVECGFRCEREQGSAAYFSRYNNRPDLGNVGIYANSGYIYRGAGYIQLTGAANYKKYGNLLKLDLLKNPTLANMPEYAAEIFVLYFQQHGCETWSIRGDWRKVRELINGGLVAFEQFEYYVYNLLELFFEANTKGVSSMSILSMLLKGLVKDIKANVQIQAGLQELEVVENKVVPILQKIDLVALAHQIAALSGGKITPEEVQIVELELTNGLIALEKIATALEAVANK